MPAKSPTAVNGTPAASRWGAMRSSELRRRASMATGRAEGSLVDQPPDIVGNAAILFLRRTIDRYGLGSQFERPQFLLKVIGQGGHRGVPGQTTP